MKVVKTQPRGHLPLEEWSSDWCENATARPPTSGGVDNREVHKDRREATYPRRTRTDTGALNNEKHKNKRLRTPNPGPPTGAEKKIIRNQID